MRAKRRILIADDDRDLLHALTLRCEALATQVILAENGLAALQEITEHCPDLVILDVSMPGNTGFEVCERMSADPELREIPVIILTGRSDAGTVGRCYDLLAYYVEKCHDVWPRLQPLIEELLAGGARRAAEPQSSSDAPPIEAPWVLCVDDDPEWLLSLSLRLRQYGVEVRQATAGMEGYREAFCNPARAILMDYEMPDGNGEYLLRRLKENPVTKDIPVIVVTGHRNMALERRLYNMGAAHYLNKPVDWQRLWEVLSEYVNVAGLPGGLMPSHT
jgi:CheY-like chemotaxis protein